MFVDRHVGPDESELKEMLDVVGASSLRALLDETIPEAIAEHELLSLPDPLTEHESLTLLRNIMDKNVSVQSWLGTGYSNSRLPAVIQRCLLENPGWYTQYTPYQAEIAQGRLEALLVFQTMVSELTGFDLANASLLDEATAAAEAMVFCKAHDKQNRPVFFVGSDCHPQNIEVVQGRAEPLGIEVVVEDFKKFDFSKPFGCVAVSGD